MTNSLFTKLDEAFEKIEQITANKREVSINGIKLVLGIVTGEEEDRIQAYLADRSLDYAEEPSSGSKVTDFKTGFLREIKVESLAYALKAIDGNRIDRVDFFETIIGEERQKVERHIFLRRKLKSWPAFITNYLFNQYMLLINEASEFLVPKFEIAGVKELLQEEVALENELLSEAEKQSSLEENQKTSKMQIREIQDPLTEGVLDQGL